MFGLFLFWISQFKDVFTKRLFFIRIFRVLNTVQSFIFKVQFFVSRLSLSKQLIYYINLIRFCQALFLFCFEVFQLPCRLCFNSNFHIISCCCRSVNKFFIFFWSFVLISAPVFRGEDYNITPTNKRQAFFLLFSDFHVFSFFHVSLSRRSRKLDAWFWSALLTSFPQNHCVSTLSYIKSTIRRKRIHTHSY